MGIREAGEPAGLVVHGSLVFWSTAERYGVERDDIAAGSGGYAKLGQSIGALLFPDLASDGANVYWAARASSDPS